MLRRLALSAVVIGAALFAPMYRAPARAASTTTVSIALNWLTNVEFSGIWVAQQKGWWAQAGLSVNARGFDFTNDPTVLVGAGKYQFGFQDGAAIIQARGKQVPLKAVWASAQTSPFAFITMPKSGIKTVKDFKGKRIGYQTHQRYVLDAMLNDAGLTEKDVTPAIVGFDPTVLLAGKVDAYLAFITNEPIEMAQRYHVKVNIIKASDYGYNFYSDVLFTTDSLAKSNPALVQKVVAIMDRGWKYAMAHPAEAAKIVVPKLDKSDSVSQQTAEMQALSVLSTMPGAAVGTMTAPRWQAGVSLLLKYKQISGSIPANSLFTTQFLPKS